MSLILDLPKSVPFENAAIACASALAIGAVLRPVVSKILSCVGRMFIAIGDFIRDNSAITRLRSIGCKRCATIHGLHIKENIFKASPVSPDSAFYDGPKDNPQ